MRGHAIMRQTKALIEAKGYDVIYGDTDSTFVWLKRPHSEAQAAEIGRELVSDVNAWWSQELSKASLPAPWSWSMKPTSAAFLMPTIRGADTGSKKRYAGMIQEGDAQRMVFKGLETVRTDWTPLAQQFQQELYLRIFRNQPYQDYVRETIAAADERRARRTAGLSQTPAPAAGGVSAQRTAARARRPACR